MRGLGESPAISVIITTFNRANFLPETIDSILAQSFQNFELIVVDDGSTDNTREAVRRYGSRVQYIYQPNRGPAAARNFGVQHAKGPWIAFQDSDDLSLPDHLESLYIYAQNFSACGMVFGNGAYLDGPEHNRKTIIPSKKSRRLEERGVGLADLFEKSIVRLQASMISKTAYESVGGMDESLRICHDLDLFFRLFMRYSVGYLNRVVFLYRKHEGNITRDDELRLTENIKVIEKLLHDYPRARDLLGSNSVARRLGYRYYRLAKGRWRRNDHKAAFEALEKAIALRPFDLKYRFYLFQWGRLAQTGRSYGV